MPLEFTLTDLAFSFVSGVGMGVWFFVMLLGDCDG